MVSTLVTVPVWQVAAFESSRVADRLFHLLMPAVMPILMLWSFIGFSIKFTMSYMELAPKIRNTGNSLLSALMITARSAPSNRV